MTEQLKPCPFCGGAAHFFKITDLDDKNFGGEGICCGSCPITTDLMFSLMEDCKPKLTEAWDRRAQPAQAVRPTTQQIKDAWASPELPLAPPTPIYNFVDRLFDAMLIKQPQAEAVPDAMKVVLEAMRSDPDYAWSWHCNVAMAFYDAGGDIYTANQGAARFMRMLADVEPAHELPAAPQQAEAVPPGFVVDRGFRWDGEKQQHIPQLTIEFEPVPANSPCDAQGWKDRDAVAQMFAAAQGEKP